MLRAPPHVGLVGGDRPGREQCRHDRPHAVRGGVVLVQRRWCAGSWNLAATTDGHRTAHRQYRSPEVRSTSRLTAPSSCRRNGPRRCRAPRQNRARCRIRMPGCVGEVDHLADPPNPEHVRRQHPVPLGERGNDSAPQAVSASTPNSPPQQHHRLARSGLQIVGGEPVDGDGAALVHHRVTL